MTSAIQLSVDSDRIATLVIDVADRSANVITRKFLRDLSDCVERIAKDANIVGVVVTSAKSAFIVGASLDELASALDQGMSAEQAYDWSYAISRAFRRLELCGKPVVAAINGAAVGGGFELCLACHYRVLAEESDAVVGLPEVKVGLLPGGGGTQRVPRMIGVSAAIPILVDGVQLSPQRALQLGLVNELAPRHELMTRARERVLRGTVDPVAPWDKKGFAVPGGANVINPAINRLLSERTALAVQDTRRNYPAPIAILSAIYEGAQLPFDTGLNVESEYFAQLLRDPVAGNLMRTMFFNKKRADKLARRPAGVPHRSVSKVGVVGAGQMGSGIAHVCALAGLDVVLLDRTAALAQKGADYSRKVLAKETERGRLSQEAARAAFERIQTTERNEDLAGCDLVVEAVFENREIKADVTRGIEAVLSPQVTIATNTSTLPVSGLAQVCAHADRFIGIHFFSPVERMPLVEIIVGRETSQLAVAQALDFVRQLGKTPIVVNDSRGFYTSRVFNTFCQEGQCMLQEGVHPALIENAAIMAGMPVGPLAVSDEISIELQYHVMKQAQADLGDQFLEPPAYQVVRHFCEDLMRLGRKSGHGFYDYPSGAKKRLWSGLAEQYPPSAQQPTVEEVKKRLLYVQALETVRCLDEGVLTDPADGDLGAILGWGFPAWTGGTLSFIDTVGLEAFVQESERLAARHGERFNPPPSLIARARAGTKYHSVVAS